MIAKETEYKILLASAQLAVQKPAWIETLDPNQVDWGLLFKNALYHGLLQHLYLLFQGQKGVRELDWLRRMYRANGRRNLRLASQLLRVLELLEAEAIPALVIKGPVLALQAFGDLTHRYFLDLDILVHPQDFPRAILLLSQIGFLPDPPFDPVLVEWTLRGEEDYSFYQDNRLLEVHWRLLERGVVYPLKEGDAWQDLQTVELLGKTVHTLSLANTFLLLCLHSAKHGWSRLNAVSDLARLARANPLFDWASFLASARQRGFERIVLLALHLAHTLAGLPLEDAVLARLERHPSVPRLVDQVIQRLFQPGPKPGEIDIMRFYLATRERFRDRLYFVLDQAFVPKHADWQALRLPPRLYPLYYLLRPLRLLWKFLFKPLSARLIPAFREKDA